jgi:hypothetical protein
VGHSRRSRTVSRAGVWPIKRTVAGVTREFIVAQAAGGGHPRDGTVTRIAFVGGRMPISPQGGSAAAQRTT